MTCLVLNRKSWLPMTNSFHILFKPKYKYSEVLIRPQMVLVESSLNNEQVSLMRSSYIEKYILVLKQMVLIVRVVMISSGLKNRTLLKLAKM